MTLPAKIVAARLYDLIPPAMPLEVLEEYGLKVTVCQAQAITQEILSLSTFWIRYALQANFPTQFGDMVEKYVSEQIEEQWDSKFGLGELSFGEFLQKTTRQHARWEQRTEKGAPPFKVFHQAVIEMEEQDLFPQGKGECLVALFIDFVPVEEIGAVAATIEEENC